jgi:Ca-activated chloride channel homolog
MEFEQGSVLLFLLVVPVIWLLNKMELKSRVKRLNILGQESFIFTNLTNLSPSLLKLKRILFYVAFIFLILALAKPILPYGEKEVIKKGSDLIIALDISPSMLAEDVKPNRLDRAKREIRSLVSKLPEHRIALVIFSGTAFVQVPMTYDHQWLISVLEKVDTDSISLKGTDLTQALDVSGGLFPKSNRSKAILMLTDGEDHGPGLAVVLEDLVKKQIAVYPIGIGSKEGAPIPVQKDGRTVDYKKDREGNVVVSKLQSEVLQSIAQQTSGAFFLANQQTFHLRKIYQVIESFEKKKDKTKIRVLAVQLYQYFLAVSFILFLLHYFIPVTKVKND